MKIKVEKVTTVETDEAGVTRAVVIYDRKKAKKKKGSGWLAIPETMTLQGLDAAAKTIKSLRASHIESNLERPNGWLIDMGPNMVKAVFKGRKRIRVWRALMAR